MRALRIVVVTLLGAFELAAVITTFATFDRPVAEYGYTVASDGETVASVEPGLPAAKGGIEPGDTIRYASLSVAGRLYELAGDLVAPGTALRLDVVHRGRARSTTLLPVELPRLYAVANLAFGVAGLALGTVSLALVLLRPSRMTWGFALVVPPQVLPDALVRFAHQSPAAIGFSYDIFVSLLYALLLAGVMIFASRFPNDTPCGSNRFIDRLAIPF
ncbi:MAG: hypothetical protein JOY69_02950, partial [Candidatus Eremiobacteraeota bacterium]|nr:hypothetical protein [Candidatus Eremiobacteraeota bacterium]